MSTDYSWSLGLFNRTFFTQCGYSLRSKVSCAYLLENHSDVEIERNSALSENKYKYRE